MTATVSGTSRDIPSDTRFSGTGAVRSESLPGGEFRPSSGRSLDPDLSHDEDRGLVVRPLLGLLPCRGVQSTRTSSSQ